MDYGLWIGKVDPALEWGGSQGRLMGSILLEQCKHFHGDQIILYLGREVSTPFTKVRVSLVHPSEDCECDIFQAVSILSNFLECFEIWRQCRA